MHQIGVPWRVATKDDSLLVSGDVRNVLDRDEQQLGAKMASLNLQQIRAIDARAEAEPYDDPDHARWRFDEEALAAAEPVVAIEGCVRGTESDRPSRSIVACLCLGLPGREVIARTGYDLDLELVLELGDSARLRMELRLHPGEGELLLGEPVRKGIELTVLAHGELPAEQLHFERPRLHARRLSAPQPVPVLLRRLGGGGLLPACHLLPFLP
jgi:hypothetical protein